MRQLISTLLLLLLFCGCLSVTHERAWLGGLQRVDTRPLATALAALNKAAVEQVTIMSEDKQMSFESVFQAQGQGATWIWLLPTARALTLRIDAQGESELILPPETDLPPIAPYLVLDLALRFLDIETLTPLVAPLTVRESNGVRTLQGQEKPIITVEGNCITDKVHAYSLQFTPIE